MSIYEFLERLDADPFDPALTALFLGKDAGPARQRQENDPVANPMAEDVPAVALADIAIIRHDRSGAQATLADVVKIPAGYVEKDCSGSAAMQYLEDILAEYAKEHFDAEHIVVWNDLFSLPADYLASRNVFIKPVDTMLTLEVGMDQEIGIVRRGDGPRNRLTHA